MKQELELSNWMEAWLIESVYKIYNAGEIFFKYYRKFKEATYKNKKALEVDE